MSCKLQKPYTVLTSVCDHTAHLSVPSIFALFMDLASEHAAMIGCGADKLAENGRFWLTVRTKIQITARPHLTQVVNAATWPEAPGRARANRYYVLADQNGERMIAGKCEWAIIEVGTGKLCRTADVYAPDTDYDTATVCDGGFARIAEDFADAETIGSYTVHSTDIDLGRHMNNAAYPRALFGLFSCAETDAMNVREMEVHFRTPCFEGETLTVCRRAAGDATEYGMLHADGRVAALFRIA